jgi:hypothetical protein
MSDLSSLIARLEKAEGPDRGLDGYIHNGAFGTAYVRVPESVTGFFTSNSDNGCPEVPAYSSSLDAAVSLAERVLPGCFYLASKGKTRHDEPMFAAQIMFGTDEVLGEAESDASLAAAIVAATLRALDQKGSVK